MFEHNGIGGNGVNILSGNMKVPVAPALVAVGLATVAGFVLSAALFHNRIPKPSPNDVSAQCAVFASETARADTIAIKCGLDRAGVEEVLRAALAELGIDASQLGEGVDTKAIQSAADRLNVSMDALAAVLGQGGSESEARVSKGPPTTVLVEITDQPAAAGEPTGASQPWPHLQQVSVAATADRKLVEEAVRRVELQCALAGAEIIVSKVELDCGPEAEEIDELVQKFVAQSGADTLREALLRDETARADFVEALSEASLLEEETVEALVEQLTAADSPFSDEIAELDADLRARMQRASAVVQVGQLADRMQQRQAEIADALVADDSNRADAAIVSTGEELRPMADDFAPIEDAPIVAAARVLQEAGAAYQRGAYGEAADAYARAADLISLDLLSDALRIWAVDSVELSDRDPADYLDTATAYRLQSAERLSSAAIRSGIDAAVALRRHGENLLDDGRLDEARVIIKRLAVSADPNVDMRQHFNVYNELAILTTIIARRNRDPDKFRDAAKAAAAALDSARDLGEDDTARALITWGNTQLDLYYNVGTTGALASAFDAYSEAAKILDPEDDLVNWSVAAGNMAIVQTQRSRVENDPELLEDAIETYRDLLGRVKRGTLRWQQTTGDLASALLNLGVWRQDASRIREAIQKLDTLTESYENDQNAWRAFETRRNLASAWRLLGRETSNTSDFDRAADILAELQLEEDLDGALDLWVELKVEQGRLSEEIGRLNGNANEYLAAAGHYAQARDRLAPEGAPLLYSELSRNEALAVYRALDLGASASERLRAEELARQVIAIGEAEGVDSEKWTKLVEDANWVISQLDREAE